MANQRAIQALKSKDAAMRKKAITALAKSADRDVLPYLAKVAKNDPDAELRALARKGGIYIQKQIQAEQESYHSQETYAESYSTSNKDDIERALDYYVIGQYGEAKAALADALRKDRHLADDARMRSAASQIYGTDSDMAIRAIAASLDKKKSKKKRGSSGIGIKPGMISILMIVGMVIGALVTGYAFFQPWLGTENQLSGFSYTGADIASNQDDVALALSLRNVVDAINAGDMGAANTAVNALRTFDRDVLSYSMYLVPIGVLGMIVFVVLGLSQKPGPVFWISGLGIVMVTGVGFWWFNQGVDALLELLVLLDANTLPFPTNAIVASGFDIGLIGIIIMVGSGVLGLITSFFVERD